MGMASFSILHKAGFFVMGVLMLVTIGMGFDRRINYDPIIGKVRKIEATCYLEKVSTGVFSKTTDTSDAMMCGHAEKLHTDHPRFQEMTVKGSIIVEVDYISPIDNSIHEGRLKYGYEGNQYLVSMHPGESLQFLAHKSDPNKIQHK